MVNVRVVVDARGLTAALRALKKALDRDGINREIRARQRYVKPSEKKKQKSKAAWKRAQKRARREAAAQERRSEVASPQPRGRRPA